MQSQETESRRQSTERIKCLIPLSFGEFFFFGKTIGAREVAFDSVLAKIQNDCSAFRDWLLIDLPFVLSYGSETWPLKEYDVIRLERNFEDW